MSLYICYNFKSYSLMNVILWNKRLLYAWVDSTTNIYILISLYYKFYYIVN